MNATCSAIPPAASPAHVRLMDVLAAPRYAGTRARQWWALGLYLLLAAGALTLGCIVRDPRSTLLAIVIYAAGCAVLAAWWAGLLLAARDARRLRVPGVAGNAAAATCLYSLVAVVLPALVVAGAGGHPAPAVLFPALAVTGMYAFLLLPRWASMWIGFLPAIYIGLRNGHRITSPTTLQFQHWAWLALLALVVIDVLRWGQLLRSESDSAIGWHSTLLMQFRQNMLSRSWNIDRQWNWWRTAKRTLGVDFRGVAPGHPVAAIRVALAPAFVPQTWRSRFGSFARSAALVAVLFIGATWLLNTQGSAAAPALWKVMALSMGAWVALFGAIMLSIVTVLTVQRRWRDHAGLAILALLPGLGVDRSPWPVLRATLAPALTWMLVLWAATLATLAFVYPQPLVMLLITLFDATLATLLVMATLRTLTGRPLGTVAMTILAVLIIGLGDADFTLATVHGAAHAHTNPLFGWLAAFAWIAIIAWALWQGIRAWRALRRQPHVFLGAAAG